MKNKAVAVGREGERDPKYLGILERLLHTGAYGVTVVLRLDDRKRDVRLVIEDVVGALPFPLVTSIPRTIMRPRVKRTSSRIWVRGSQPAFVTAGVMNFEQMSRSLSAFLLMATAIQMSTPSRQGLGAVHAF
jgi:hypothetical protein